MRKFSEGDATKLTPGERAEREDARDMSIIQAKKRMLGNIRFVGELYKLPQKMLQDKVMHRCVQKLLHVTNDDPDDLDGGPAQDEAGNPELREVKRLTEKDEEDIESLCKLLTTIGAKLEQDAQKDAFKVQLMSLYFERLKLLATDKSFPSRMRFMVQDYFELRANNYVPRRKEDKQMTQEEMRKIAVREYGRNDTSMGNAMQPIGNVHAGKGKGGKGPSGNGGAFSSIGQGKGGPQSHRGDYARGADNRGSGRNAVPYGQGPNLSARVGIGNAIRRGHGDIRVMQRSVDHAQFQNGQRIIRPDQQQQQQFDKPPPPLHHPRDLKKLLSSFISDWSATRDEAETLQAWYALCGGGGSVTGELLVNVAIERAADAKKLERTAIADLLVLLGKLPIKGLKQLDFEVPLSQYLEYLEDMLCDIPGLHGNLAEVSRAMEFR